MREIFLNGYIDEDVWFGDEITPGMLHDELYGQGRDPKEDIRIILNSYGGSCNAATRMFDTLRDYPGKVHLIISGTAASAATVIAMAANKLEMTPGSLFMIHDPMLAAYGNEGDLTAAIERLQVCKNSIINIYQERTWKTRDELAEMMRVTTWMDANDAKSHGFVDDIVTAPIEGIENAAMPRAVSLEDAQARYAEWHDRQRPIARKCTVLQNRAEPESAPVPEADVSEEPETSNESQPEIAGVSAEMLLRQLDAIRNW